MCRQAYRAERVPTAELWEEEVGQHYKGGQIYRPDLLPVPSYLARCLAAFAKLPVHAASAGRCHRARWGRACVGACVWGRVGGGGGGGGGDPPLRAQPHSPALAPPALAPCIGAAPHCMLQPSLARPREPDRPRATPTCWTARSLAIDPPPSDSTCRSALQPCNPRPPLCLVAVVPACWVASVIPPPLAAADGGSGSGDGPDRLASAGAAAPATVPVETACHWLLRRRR